MYCSPERPHVYYDVDYTLVRPLKWLDKDDQRIIVFNGFSWIVNNDMIKEIELSKARGHVVIVWSQGGAKWAEDVVKALQIEHMVDACLAKPSWYADDKPHEEILDKTRQFFREF